VQYKCAGIEIHDLTFPVFGIDFFIMRATFAIGRNRSCGENWNNCCINTNSKQSQARL